MDLHSERLEAKLKAVDWAVRDVLVGTMRSLQQLDICRKDCFYYIPAERLQDSDFPVRYVALYQSQYVFSPMPQVLYGIVMVLIHTIVMDKMLMMGASRTEVKIIKIGRAHV